MLQSAVKKNEVYTVEITGMSHEGMGIGKVNGFTVFVENAALGELVEIIIIKVNKNFSFGKVNKIIKVSEGRVEPKCSIAVRCGGCQLQHLSYEEQLKFKTQKVKDALERIGKIENAIVHDTIGMSEPLRYRNKAQYPVGIKGDKIQLGFYAQRSHEIIDTSECMIQHSESEKIANITRRFIEKYKIEVYSEIKHSGIIRHVVTKVGFKTNEIMVVIVTNGSKLPFKDEFISELVTQIPNIKSIIQNINSQETNVILGKKCITLFGSDTISDYIGEFKFNISPLSFFQVNPVQTEVLYGKALKYAGLTGKEIVFDAYCGIGTISLFLSKNAKKVYGIEIVEQAIADAKVNAKINGVENIEFLVGESEKLIPDLHKKGIKADLVVVDPPRKGCEKSLLDTIIEMKPRRVVYVSCDVGTLSRDLRILEDGGYEVVEVQPVDMFPWTWHVETVVKLNRKHS